MALSKIKKGLLDVGTVDSTIIEDGVVAAVDIEDDSVTTDKILNEAVTNAKLEASLQASISGGVNPVIATQGEAQTGTDNTKQMTPLRVSEAIQFQISIPDTASQAEAEAGVENTKYMTALRVKQAVEAQAVTSSVLTTIQNNIMLNAFRISINGGLSLLQMIDAFIDEFEDETGIDTGASINETYDSGADLYNNVAGIDMTLISNAQTAQSQPDTARIVLFEEDVDTVIPNTDLKAFVSRDNGTTWTQVTLVDEGLIDTNLTICAGEISIAGQPAGTNMKYKVETFNTKEIKLHGVALQWK